MTERLRNARYARQMIVSDIGEAGQLRLESGTAEVAGLGLAHEIAEAYATRAGMRDVRPGAIDETALAPSFLENPAARAVVAGSRAALAAVRRALTTDPSSHVDS